MIRFIVVDDDVKMQHEIKKIINTITFSNKNSIVIKNYKGDCSKLENDIADKSQRTIYLLDIDLNSEITGISIAQMIRKHDWDSEIIFLTNHDQYFEKVYRSIFKIFDFIEKFDHMNIRLTNDIETILKQDYDTKMFKYSNRHIDMQIYLKDILYISRDTSTRKVMIVTTKNKFLINKSIASIKQQLDQRFILVHRSCIVNKNHVNVFKWNEGSFILDNNEEVFLLSKKYKCQLN